MIQHNLSNRSPYVKQKSYQDIMLKLLQSEISIPGAKHITNIWENTMAAANGFWCLVKSIQF